jgi:hypothetical protein
MGWPDAPSVGADESAEVLQFLLDCVTYGGTNADEGWVDRLKANYVLLRRSEVANETVYVDEKTYTKVMRALAKAGLDFEQSLEVVEAVQDAGLLFREPRRKDSPEPTPMPNSGTIAVPRAGDSRPDDAGVKGLDTVTTANEV